MVERHNCLTLREGGRGGGAGTICDFTADYPRRAFLFSIRKKTKKKIKAKNLCLEVHWGGGSM